ncbi:MAG: hypothetical protein SNJ63_09995, partial [Sphingomonadaceae bacterium]
MRILHAWLSRLDQDIEDLCRGQPGNAVLANLRRQIQAFANDCLDERLQPGVRTHAAELTVGPPAGDLPPLYRLLRREVTVAPPPPGTSDCLIGLREVLAPDLPFKGLVLLDEGIARSRNLPASRIIFWGRTTLRQALDQPPAGRSALRQKMAKEGYLMVEPADFFAPVLVKLDDTDFQGRIQAHVGQDRDDFSNCLLPLSPLALLVAGRESLKVRTSRDQDDHVTFRVPLAGDGEIHHVVRRRYRENPLEGEGRLLSKVMWALGDVALWPNFEWSKWKHYFARIKYPLYSPRRLRGRLATSGPALAASLKQAAGADGSAALATWVSGKPFLAKRDPWPDLAGRITLDRAVRRFRASEKDKGASEIQRASDPFEAVFFTIIPDIKGANGQIIPEDERQAVPAGLVVVGYKKLPREPDGAAKIAVDFGTTNTVACLGVADDATPAVLAPRVLDPIAAGSPRMQQEAAEVGNRDYIEFFPPTERALPTPSVVIARNMDEAGSRAIKHGNPQAIEELLFSNIVYFQPDLAGTNQAEALLAEWTSALSRTTFNLKWTTKPSERRAALHYLRQLALMLGAEAAARGHDPWQSEWLFSRPEALMNDVEADGTFIQGLLTAMQTAFPGIALDNISPRHSESIAAASYILSPQIGQGFARGDVNVILDIGGGTTDIAIWDNSPQPRLKWSGSLRVAGGDFFTKHIGQNPQLLGTLGLPVWQTVMEMPADRYGGRPRQFVAELLFSGSRLEKAFDAAWVTVSGTEDVRRLVQTCAIFLGGIAWHVGGLVRALVEENQLDGHAPRKIAVALCGRGSGLFARLHRLNPDRGQVGALLKLVGAAAGIEHPERPRIFLSPHPKIEVVAGMMRGNHAQFEQAAAFGAGGMPAPMGVRFDPGEEGRFGPPAMDPDFASFLVALERHAGLKVTLSERQWRLISQVADQNAPSENQAAALGVPRFARLLRELLAAVALPPANEDRPQVAEVGAAP